MPKSSSNSVPPNDRVAIRSVPFLLTIMAICFAVACYAGDKLESNSLNNILYTDTDSNILVEVNTYKQLTSPCRANEKDIISYMGRDEYDNDTLNTRSCGYNNREISPD